MRIGYKLEPGAKAPETAYDSPGIDLFAAEGRTLFPGDSILVSLGVSFEIPHGYVGILKDRSSSWGFVTLAGVIDPDYRGVVKAKVHNLSEHYRIEIQKGDKLVQMLVVPAPIPTLFPLQEMSATDRGDKGFGSSDSNV